MQKSSFLPDHSNWQQAVASQTELLERFRSSIQSLNEFLFEQFNQDVAIENIIKHRSQAMDELLSHAWRFFFADTTDMALIAVGGYGRQELLPHSDIDLLLLANEKALTEQTSQLEAFITFLWDTKLDIGHSVRTIDECISLAKDDITIITNLMESRHIIGTTDLHQQLLPQITPEKIWPSKDFFKAKWDEQIERHKKLNNTEYNLEPNIKSSPGGLRDIQMIGWIAKRHFNVNSIDDLVEIGFLTPEEQRVMQQGQSFLLKIRFALHSITKREEDRLLFGHQTNIAKLFGYEQDNAGNLAVEKMMKEYFRWAMALSELNDLVMQLFDETILRACDAEDIMEINPRFRVRNQRIEATNDRVFIQNPSALLEIFVLMSKHEQIEGVRAQTIRLLRQSRDLINEEFRQDENNKQLFVELLRSPRKIASQFKLMKRYGILGKYIPAFGDIIGQSQHDLFHIYTVDAHTILVLKNARRFSYEEPNGKNPVVSKVVRQMEQKDLLYLACLFHDIGKGRGGDHSTLGAEDAYVFCREHGYNLRDSNLVAWLVKNHLLMSFTAQKKDISDPDVVRKFALKMGDQKHLDYLFALTISDISGTNPTLWNSWRASLLRRLYQETKRMLRHGLEVIIDKQELIDEKQQKALAKLSDTQAAKGLWSSIHDDYFIHESVDNILWQTQEIINRQERKKSILAVRNSDNLILQGATQIFIYTAYKVHTFALVTSALEKHQMNIVDAKIYPVDGDYIIAKFLVLDSQGKPLTEDQAQLNALAVELNEQLDAQEIYRPQHESRTPRQLKFFPVPTQAQFIHNAEKNISALEVITADRPGLLATIADIFIENKLILTNAKITTLGEKVEDVFFVTDQNNQYLQNEALCAFILQTICKRLDKQVAKSS